MNYEINEAQKEKAKNWIKIHQKNRKKIVKELERAKTELKTCANKYYQGIKFRIDSLEKDIAKIDKHIAELKDCVKKGYIKI